MEEKIRVIIAEDNTGFCDLLKKYFSKYDDIELLGIANNDETEIDMIETLKPEIVITDLMRNHKYTGLDIIREYSKKKESPYFIVISAGDDMDFRKENLKISAFIRKPIFDFNIILNLLKNTKMRINSEKCNLVVKDKTVITKFNLFTRILNCLKIRK